METRDLQYFVAVAEEANFTRAAERLLVAQPHVSQRIREMERVLGRSLFERTSRRVNLTAAGQRLLMLARPLLEQLDSIEGQMGSSTEEVTEDLTVAAIKSLPGVQLSALIHTFRRRHPGVRFILRELTTTTMLDELAAGAIDLAIAQAPEGNRSGLIIDDLARDDFVLIVPLEHRLAHQHTVSMSELGAEVFITLDRGSGTQRTLRTAAKKAGFMPRVMIEVLQLDTVRELVAAGLGVALMPRSKAETAGPAVSVLDMGPPKLARRIVIATPEVGSSPGALAFREIILDAFMRAHNSPAS
ncbi:LysR family transcriptional regulator [Streptomyces sp. DSM 41524]|uniref:LysR family transcriptional regulator n=1 Tax=Streptomyces asiaticus subsp. ignotus TaxID=3098222 RepID=A0ABU7QEL6_9ACTN|nr:LysR family transcriptional regulator [Streptomyces sp. DSM 41524]